MDITNEIESIEKKFLSYLFHDKKYIAATIGIITKEHLPNHYKIYSLLMSYYGKYKDIITDQMVDIMFQKKNMDTNTVIAYKTLISQLRSEKFFNDGEFKALIEQLTENKERQEVLKVAEEIVNINPIECSSNDFKSLKDSIKTSIIKTTVNVNDVINEGTIKDSAKSRIERYNEIEKNPELIKFVPTGFKHIDDENGGFRPGEFICIIGRKGDGKSTLLLNLAHNMWSSGYNVIIFSLEISKEDYERRFDSRAAEVSSNGIKMGRLTDDEKDRYFKYLKAQENNTTIDNQQAGIVYIVDTPPGITPAFVDSKLDSVEQILGIKFDVVITDYMGIMNPTVAVAEKRHQYGQIALDQKIIARQRKCILITAAQKTRAGAKEKNSDSSYVAESDQVSDHIDWGIDIMSTSEDYGVIQSFKTRDSSPFKFSFKKQYNMFKIQELEGDEDCWDQIS